MSNYRHENGLFHEGHHHHDHDHEHHHDHEHCEHPEQEAHCGHDCSACSADPKAELKALMGYMVKHNRSHCAELEQLAKRMNELGLSTGYDQVMLAVSDFEKGNLRLSTVLAAMGEE